MLGDRAAAQDLTQETFVRAFTHLGSFDPRFKFSNWVLRIARNLAIDAIRRRGPHLVSLDAEEGTWAGAGDVPSPDANEGIRLIEQEDLGRAMAEALSHLRPEYRQVVILRYHEESTHEEIAAITGLPVGTVKSHLHRARAQMAIFLAERGWR